MRKVCYVTPILALLLVYGFHLAGCSKAEDTKTTSISDAPDSLATIQPIDSLVIELKGADSLTVLDVLLKAHKADYFATGAGVFVREIDSTAASDDFFWLYSVNNVMPQVAADRYLTRDGDVIKWHFRRINE